MQGSVFRPRFLITNANLLISPVGKPSMKSFFRNTMIVTIPDPYYLLFSLWSWSGSKSSLLCGSGPAPHQSDANLRPLVYRPSGSKLSIHASIVGDKHPRPSIASLWASTAPEFWLWCGSDPDLALDFDADPDPHPKIKRILADPDAQHCTNDNLTHERQSNILCVLEVTPNLPEEVTSLCDCLKGQCHEIFDMCFPWIIFPPGPDISRSSISRQNMKTPSF